MKQVIITIVLASFVIFLASLLITFPKEAFDASLLGLNMWWEVVFPSLLPFFIIAELLLSFGVVKFIGRILEPVMRPIFNVPGVGSFAWIMGMASGYPTGAKITARLREEGELSQIEAERLVAFTNASSPLFIFGAIAVGFFHDAALGLFIAVCHYAGNLLVGICMRFYGKNPKQKESMTKKSVKRKTTLKQAFKEMHQMRMADTRPLGMILGDAVIQSIKTLIMVGGFIILFSVLTEMLYLVHITQIVANLIEYVLNMFTLPGDLSLPLVSGLFEITVGANLISQISADPLLAKIIIISFILGFNGFSIQAQVASILANTDIRFYPYFMARLLHGIFASILTIILYYPLYVARKPIAGSNVPVMYPNQVDAWMKAFSFIKEIGPYFSFIFVGIAIIIMFNRTRKMRV